MAKPGYMLIAEHFGTDTETVRDHAYQPGRFTRPVYSFTNGYWCAGKTPAQPTRSSDRWQWEKVVSSYDGVSVLWVCKDADEVTP